MLGVLRTVAPPPQPAFQGGLCFFRMPTDLVSILFLVATCAVTFVVARLVGRKWRAKRQEREQSATRAAESRQVRRARERRQR